MFTLDDYKKLLRKLPDGTINRTAEKMGCDRTTIYNRLQKGDLETVATVTAIAKELAAEQEQELAKAKQLADSL